MQIVNGIQIIIKLSKAPPFPFHADCKPFSAHSATMIPLPALALTPSMSRHTAHSLNVATATRLL